MINVSYIHRFDLLDQIEENYNESINEIEEAYAPILLLEEEIEDKLFFNESIDDCIDAMEGVEDTFFEKIGRTILNIIERCKKTIIKIVTDVKEQLWSNISTAAKKEMILRKCPNLSERVKTSLDKNMIDLSDLKSFEDFNKNYEKLLDELERAQDPSKVRAKWEKIKDDFDKNSDRIIKAGKVVGAVVTIAGVIGIGRTVKANADKIDPDAMEKMTDYNLDKTSKKVETLEKMRTNHDVKTKLSMIATMSADYEKRTTGEISRLTSIKLNAYRAVDKAYSKLIPNASIKSENNINKMLNNYKDTQKTLKNHLNELHNRNVNRRSDNYYK